MPPEQEARGLPYTPRHLRGILELPEAREGERKDVTVLFADVAGSLALTSALDPEDLHAVMNGLFALVNQAVHAEGGRINQYRGDGFMALFGAPRALRDHAAHACRAALEIRDSAERYAESVRARFGHPLLLRFGINTGPVWVGSIGTDLRADYTAEGTTVGAAARLEARAVPGQILAGGETQRRCEPFFEWAPLGEQCVRGLPEPIVVFELLRRGPHGQRLDVEQARGLSPFSGRSEELAWLAAKASPATGGVRCAEIRGEAGIGKSRLVLEHVQRLRAAVAVLTLVGREFRQDRAFLPWLELLRHWPAGLPQVPGLAALRDRLEGRAADVDGDVRSALRSLVAAVSAQQPTLIVADDAQWLDPSSRRVLRALAEHPPEGSLTLLATVCGEARDSWGPAGVTACLDLGPLDEESAQALAASLLQELPEPEELVQLAVARGGGVPLFVEELARALCDGSASLRRAARLEASLLREPEQLPHTLHDVIAARIDALPAHAKRAVEAAAVLAQPFDAELLTALEPAAAPAVPVLLARGLLRTAEGGDLDLRHALVREVAYRQLLRMRRAELHRRAADALMARPAIETPDGAARAGLHYERAGEPRSAAPLLLRAGRQYADMDSPDEAASLLGRGLQHLRACEIPSPEQEASAAILLATCLNTLDRSEEAAAVLESLDERATAAADPSTLAQALIQAGWVRFSALADLHGARELIERGLALIEGQPALHRAVTLGHSYLSRMFLLDGDVKRAAHHTSHVVTLAAARQDVLGQVMGLFNLSQALCDGGDLAEAARAAQRAGELAQGREDELMAGLAEVAAARVELFTGEVDKARASIARGVRCGERAGQVGLRYHATVLRGYLHALQGESRAAHASFEHLVELNDAWPGTALHRARGHLEIGDLERAAELARHCLEREATRMVRARAQALLGVALGLSDAQAVAEAERCLAESVSLCDALGLRPYRAEAHLFLAELLAECKESRRARYYAERATQGYASCGMRLHAERAERFLQRLH